MNCCKLYLVPEDVINTWRAEQRESAVEKPVRTMVTQMDSGMNGILQSNLPDYDKEKLYSQELSKYLTMREQTKSPAVQPRPLDPSLSSMPKTFKTKAEGLLEYLKADKDIEWDQEGHVSVGQDKLEGSHILDLLHDAMRLRKKVGHPAGWEQLSRHLQGKNVPRELVGNKEWFDTHSTPRVIPKDSGTPLTSRTRKDFGTPTDSKAHKSIRRKVMRSVQKSKGKEEAQKDWRKIKKDWQAV